MSALLLSTHIISCLYSFLRFYKTSNFFISILAIKLSILYIMKSISNTIKSNYVFQAILIPIIPECLHRFVC